jgi:CDGSH-type Zn-finger protein
VAVCRCGGSARKPFCDGTHRDAGFDGTCLRQDDRQDDAVSP